MKKVVKLSENDLEKIVNSVLNEQDKLNVSDLMVPGGRRAAGGFNPPLPGEKYGESSGPGKLMRKGEYQPSVTMPSNLFKNGIDKIDTNSSAFKQGVDGIRKAIASKGENINISVEGGASAVGSKEGYDNESLAQRRAQNFIRAVQSQFPNVKFKVSTKVGSATTKNSPEAEREQYVKLTFPGSLSADKTAQAVDKTQLVMKYKKPMKPIEKVKIREKTYYKVCFWVPEESFEQVVSLIQSVKGIEV